MIITVTDQSAAVTTPDRLVSHSASVYTATFVLDSTWDSLTKMVVFKAGEKSKAFGTPTIEKGMTGTSVIVPWEPLAVYGRELWVGIYGTDSTGLVKPTTWADAGTILQGVDIDADNAQEPTEGLYQKWVDEVSGYATTASTAATSAKASADSAAASVTQIGTSVTDAAASATAAKASETAAATSASNASASATAAKTSDTNAKSSETAAKTSETNAASSASSASTSAGTATTAASGASTSETNAKASETAAASSASAASTSAANAKTSETNAASSASSASSSASSASTSATNAASSATAAQTAAASIDMTNYYNKTETNNLLSAKAAETEVTAVMQSLSSKQDALTAGKNITILDNVISASGGGSKLNVTFASAFIGATYTITSSDSSEIISGGTVSESSSAEISVTGEGRTYTVTSSANGSTYSAQVETGKYYGIYDVTLNVFTTVVYTVVMDFSVSTPASMCTYADDAAGMSSGHAAWKDKEIFKNIKSCLLNSSGTRLGYLNEDNVAKYTDGTAAPITTVGNDVMIEYPEVIGYKFSLSGTKLTVSVTNELNKSGYSYDAFSYAGTADASALYIGRYLGYQTGSKMYSVSGQTPTASVTIGTCRTAARARGTGYEQIGFAQLKLRQALDIIKFANGNMQDAVGWGYVGGSAKTVTGGGNAYGADSEVIKASNPSYLTDKVHQVVCNGMEDEWGNALQWIDGVVTDASYNILTAKKASDFNDSGSNYTSHNVGITTTLSGYINGVQGTNDLGLIVKAAGGSDSTYLCDYGYVGPSYVAYAGGYYSNGSNAGPFQFDLYNSASGSNAIVAGRLMFLKI